MQGNCSCFCSGLLTFFRNQVFQIILSGTLSECQIVWIQIRTDIIQGQHSVGPDLNPNCFLLIWFYSLRPSQRFFSYVGTGFLEWVEPIFSKDQGVLLKDTMEWCRWCSNLQLLGLKSSTVPLSHCPPTVHTVCKGYQQTSKVATSKQRTKHFLEPQVKISKLCLIIVQIDLIK